MQEDGKFEASLNQVRKTQFQKHQAQPHLYCVYFVERHFNVKVHEKNRKGEEGRQGRGKDSGEVQGKKGERI
jgi:hypothetical protein